MHVGRNRLQKSDAEAGGRGVEAEFGGGQSFANKERATANLTLHAFTLDRGGSFALAVCTRDNRGKLSNNYITIEKIISLQFRIFTRFICLLPGDKYLLYVTCISLLRLTYTSHSQTPSAQTTPVMPNSMKLTSLLFISCPQTQFFIYYLLC